MLLFFSILFAASAATMVALLARKIPQARAVAVLKNAGQPGVPVAAVMNVAVAQAGNVFARLFEKLLRRLKIFSLKFDNVATRWIARLRERSKEHSLRHSEWRMRKQGFPKISFDSSFVAEIEEWFLGFFRRYFRRGVGYERATVREDLEPREKVLVAAILADPKNASAYRDLGLYYFEQDNLPDALQAFEAIRKIDPTNSEAAERVAHIKEVMWMAGRAGAK